MIQVRKAQDRGHANHGWLDTYHTFSFSTYQDRDHMKFRSLRVMNEDTVAPGQGFGTHPHNDMEIVTYVLSGALEHKDSMGNGEVLRPGEFQRMTAGTGITHSEFNPSASEPVHLYQIWLFPERKGIEPSYEQKRFPEAERHNQLRLVASRNADKGSLLIHTDARIYLSQIDSGNEIGHELIAGRHAWLQVLRGSVSLNGVDLNTSDVATYMASEGVPMPQVALGGAIVFLIAGSLSVIAGFRIRLGAALLLVFLVLATYYFHDFWKFEGQEQQMQMIQFMKNLSLMGTMVFFVANGAGGMSLDAGLAARKSD